MPTQKEYNDIVVRKTRFIAYAQNSGAYFKQRRHIKKVYFEHLLSILDEIDFPSGNLCLELTERCRFMDLEFLRNEIIFLKSHGIRVALDDFGTGFSAMELLINLPIDTIKIDRSFVLDIENKKRETACRKGNPGVRKKPWRQIHG